jgi:hypothetical protein
MRRGRKVKIPTRRFSADLILDTVALVFSTVWLLRLCLFPFPFDFFFPFGDPSAVPLEAPA